MVEEWICFKKKGNMGQLVEIKEKNFITIR